MNRSAGPGILIAGYYGAGNLGDEAILAAVLAGLGRVAPGCLPTVVSRDPERTAREHATAAIRRGDVSALLAAAEAADLVVVGGGGLFQDHWGLDPDSLLRRSAGGIPAYAGPIVLARILGRPSLLWAVGVGPLRSSAARRETARAFALAGAASVRDEESRALVEAALDEHPQPERPAIAVAADPAFALAEAAGDEAGAQGELARLGLSGEPGFVAVSLRHWEEGLTPGGWLPGVVAGIERALAGLSEGERPRVLLIPLQSGGPTAFEDDLAVLRAARVRFRKPELVAVLEAVPAPTCLLAILARARAVVAMRLHAALLSICAGQAPVALVYDGKLDSLMRSAGLVDRAVPIAEAGAEAVAVRLSRALEEGEGRRAAMIDFARRMAGRAALPAGQAAELLARPAPPADPHRDWLRDQLLAWIGRVERLDLEVERLESVPAGAGPGRGLAARLARLLGG